MGLLREIPKEYMSTRIVYMRQCDDEQTEHTYYLKDILIIEFKDIQERLYPYFSPLVFRWFSLFRDKNNHLPINSVELFWWCVTNKSEDWFFERDKLMYAFSLDRSPSPRWGMGVLECGICDDFVVNCSCGEFPRGPLNSPTTSFITQASTMSSPLSSPESSPLLRPALLQRVLRTLDHMI